MLEDIKIQPHTIASTIPWTTLSSNSGTIYSSNQAKKKKESGNMRISLEI